MGGSNLRSKLAVTIKRAAVYCMKEMALLRVRVILSLQSRYNTAFSLHFSLVIHNISFKKITLWLLFRLKEYKKNVLRRIQNKLLQVLFTIFSCLKENDKIKAANFYDRFSPVWTTVTHYFNNTNHIYSWRSTIKCKYMFIIVQITPRQMPNAHTWILFSRTCI